MASGLASYAGVERRFQRLGEARGVVVVDDYAHNPGKVAATLATARVAYPDRRLVVAFQPHLFTRTRDFAREFGASLAAADAVFLTEIYPAREQPIAGVSVGHGGRRSRGGWRNAVVARRARAACGRARDGGARWRRRADGRRG